MHKVNQHARGMTISGCSPPIYLDHHATTPLDPRVLEAMMPYLTTEFGNPSSNTHIYGQSAKNALESARAIVASCIGAKPSEVIFTSGATEANNMVIRGILPKSTSRQVHIVSSATEHHAVLEPLAHIGRAGHRYTLLNARPNGTPNAGCLVPEDFEAAIEESTIAASIMFANNVVGSVNPIAKIGAIARRRGVLLHTDATQAMGTIPIDVNALGVDYLSGSAHKVYGPKGIGFLYIRNSLQDSLRPIITGGRQESGRRGGTLNMPSIVGLATALRIAEEERQTEVHRISSLRNELWNRLSGRITGLRLVGPVLDQPDLRLAGNLNITIEGIDSRALMASIPEIALSNGSACVSDNSEPSHVLVFLGLSNSEAKSSLRIGLGRFTTIDDISQAALHISEKVHTLRSDAQTARSSNIRYASEIKPVLENS